MVYILFLIGGWEKDAFRDLWTDSVYYVSATEETTAWLPVKYSTYQGWQVKVFTDAGTPNINLNIKYQTTFDTSLAPEAWENLITFTSDTITLPNSFYLDPCFYIRFRFISTGDSTGLIFKLGLLP